MLSSRLVVARRDAQALRTHSGALYRLMADRPHLRDDSTRADRLIAVDAAALAAAVEPCVEHEYASVQGPADQVAAPLTTAEISHERFDWQAQLEN